MLVEGDYNQAKVFTDKLEEEARLQIKELLSQDFMQGAKVRIMPDVHKGMGCVIGFTADMGDKIIPNIVGVDIGCGMLTIKLARPKLDLEKIDRIINENIPAGYKVHRKRQLKFDRLKDLHVLDQIKNLDRIERSLGSLGGGNHFIEIGRDSDKNAYMVIHSGSRNLGKQVADIYQALAIDFCQDKAYPKELCYLGPEARDNYLDDMKICQDYASLNRKLMANIILEKAFNTSLEDYEHFETIHNYIDFRDNIIRKGAISARQGEEVLIPINMRDGSILARGRGNQDWNQSAPHGAGRLLSRTQARKEHSLARFKQDMEGIYTSSLGRSTLDENPRAYKPMEEILSRLDDTAQLIDIIRPIYNFKAK